MIDTVQLNVWASPQWGITWKSDWVRQEVHTALYGKQIQDFVSSLNIEWLKSLFQSIPETPEERRKKFIDDLLSIVQVYRDFEKIVKTNESFQKYYEHDVRTVWTLSPLLDALTQFEALSIDSYIPMVQKASKIFVAFLESLYYIIPMPLDFIESKKTKFSLLEALDIAILASELQTGNIWDVRIYGLEKIEDTLVSWIEWDFIIFLMNILKNAKKHGKATVVRLWIKKEWTQTSLIIDDNGTWIPKEVIGSIFEAGKSWGWSTGIWLRDIHARWLEVTAENQWLLSWIDANSQGARFTIHLK